MICDSPVRYNYSSSSSTSLDLARPTCASTACDPLRHHRARRPLLCLLCQGWGRPCSAVLEPCAALSPRRSVHRVSLSRQNGLYDILVNRLCIVFLYFSGFVLGFLDLREYNFYFNFQVLLVDKDLFGFRHVKNSCLLFLCCIQSCLYNHMVVRRPCPHKLESYTYGPTLGGTMDQVRVYGGKVSVQPYGGPEYFWCCI